MYQIEYIENNKMINLKNIFLIKASFIPIILKLSNFPYFGLYSDPLKISVAFFFKNTSNFSSGCAFR
ncbi:hypothetical protein SAMN04488097_2111 [Epilithonimonas lactis]|nr:hypothetical protein SAMN04488097_2111 [Epilithonimonas lactis]